MYVPLANASNCVLSLILESSHVHVRTHKANECVPITDLFFHSRVCASIRSHYVQNAIWKTPEEKYLIKYKYVIN